LRPIAAGLGYAYALQGRLAEGRALLEEAISEVSARARCKSCPWVAWLSEVCRLAGRGEEAWQHARQALDLARQLKARGNEALALHQLGVVHAHADPPMPRRPKRTTSRPGPAGGTGHAPARGPLPPGLGRLFTRTGVLGAAALPCPPLSTSTAPWNMTFWLPQPKRLAQVEGRP
jgi:hypothetical protein